jgi:hypothetical protein
MTRTPLERTRQRLQAATYFGLPLGLINLAIGLSRPTISGMRTNDLIQLLATGICLGAGMVGLIVLLVSRRDG